MISVQLIEFVKMNEVNEMGNTPRYRPLKGTHAFIERVKNEPGQLQPSSFFREQGLN